MKTNELISLVTKLQYAQEAQEFRQNDEAIGDAIKVIEVQAARIRELEGALRVMVEQYGCLMRITRGVNPDVNGDPYVAQARSALRKANPHA